MVRDRIAKQKLNIILLVDSSGSMRGARINQVEQAIRDIKDYLVNLQAENTNIDFYLSLITFGTEASFYKNERTINISDLDFKGIEIKGHTNLHCGYELLGSILKKESQGGIMPDFGGVAPIILLLTDGHPTGNLYKDKLKEIENIPWFKVALRYGIAIGLDDKRTTNVLRDFVGNNGDVITCFDNGLLKNIIKVIVLTASKVKSTSSTTNNLTVSQNEEVKQQISQALDEIEEWEW